MTFSGPKFFKLTDLLDSEIVSPADNELLSYDSSTSSWINQTLAELGIASSSHTHNTAAITSGILPVLRGGTGTGSLPVPSNFTNTNSNIGGYLTGIDNALGAKIENLSAFDTGDLSEGSNLYFTDERVDDRVASLLTAGSNISLTYDDGAGTLTIDATASGGSSTLSGLDDVTLSSIADGELLVYDSSGLEWINNTLAEAGVAAATHTHAAADVVSGTFADGRISESSVIQHESALTITESQVSDLGSYFEAGDTILAANGTLSNPGLSFSTYPDFGLYMQSSTRMDIVANGTSVAALTNNTIFSIAQFTAEVTQFTASISWISSSTDAIFNNTTSSAAAKLTLREATTNGTNGVSFNAPVSLASNVSFVVPNSDGTADQVLVTDGSGNLSFANNDDKLIQYSLTHEAPSNDSYVIERYMPDRGGTLEEIYYATDSGTCTLNITIDGVSVGSWSALSASSTEGNTSASGSNTFSGGETLRVVVSGGSSPDMLSLTIKGTFD